MRRSTARRRAEEGEPLQVPESPSGDHRSEGRRGTLPASRTDYPVAQRSTALAHVPQPQPERFDWPTVPNMHDDETDTRCPVEARSHCRRTNALPESCEYAEGMVVINGNGRLLAAACQETLPSVSGRLADRGRGCDQVASAKAEDGSTRAGGGGPNLLRWLPRSLGQLTEKAATQTVRTVAMIGGERALEMLAGYVRTCATRAGESPTVEFLSCRYSRREWTGRDHLCSGDIHRRWSSPAPGDLTRMHGRAPHRVVSAAAGEPSSARLPRNALDSVPVRASRRGTVEIREAVVMCQIPRGHCGSRADSYRRVGRQPGHGRPDETR